MGLLSKISKVAGVASPIVGAASSLVGAHISDSNAFKQAQASWNANYNAQKEFAQNSILWRVQDAKRAGVNPNAVVGGQTVGYTPQDSSYQSSMGQAVAQAGNRFADAMGQLQYGIAQEDLKSKQLDNDIKSLEIANKSIESGMGQLPKTITKVLNPKEPSYAKLQTFANGKQRGNIDEDVDITNPQSILNFVETRGSRELVDSLTRTNPNNFTGFDMGGYYSQPRDNVDDYTHYVDSKAADIATKYGLVLGLLSRPFLGVRKGISYLLSGKTPKKSKNKFMKGGK